MVPSYLNFRLALLALGVCLLLRAELSGMSAPVRHGFVEGVFFSKHTLNAISCPSTDEGRAIKSSLLKLRFIPNENTERKRRSPIWSWWHPEWHSALDPHFIRHGNWLAHYDWLEGRDKYLAPAYRGDGCIVLEVRDISPFTSDCSHASAHILDYEVKLLDTLKGIRRNVEHLYAANVYSRTLRFNEGIYAARGFVGGLGARIQGLCSRLVRLSGKIVEHDCNGSHDKPKKASDVRLPSIRYIPPEEPALAGLLILIGLGLLGIVIKHATDSEDHEKGDKQ